MCCDADPGLLAVDGGSALTVQQTDPYHNVGDSAVANTTQQQGALSTDQQLAASLAQVLSCRFRCHPNVILQRWLL